MGHCSRRCSQKVIERRDFLGTMSPGYKKEGTRSARKRRQARLNSSFDQGKQYSIWTLCTYGPFLLLFLLRKFFARSFWTWHSGVVDCANASALIVLSDDGKGWFGSCTNPFYNAMAKSECVSVDSHKFSTELACSRPICSDPYTVHRRDAFSPNAKLKTVQLWAGGARCFGRICSEICRDRYYYPVKGLLRKVGCIANTTALVQDDRLISWLSPSCWRRLLFFFWPALPCHEWRRG